MGGDACQALTQPMTETYIRPNALGDLSAEADQRMLGQAFLETADYRTLIETSDRIVVVGRRGTGKSALALQLQKFYQREDKTVVVPIAPQEHQTIGLRPRIALFGDTFSKIRAGARLAWRFALMMETANALAPINSFRNTVAFLELKPHLDNWMESGTDIFDRYLHTIQRHANPTSTPEERINQLSAKLSLTSVETSLTRACAEATTTIVFLIDRLDEGYEPDPQGTALVDGLVHAAIDLKTRIPGVKPVVFLRDNILRAVQYLDPDYSRNIEGNVLRLHWDVESLFHFATKRLQLAFDISQEASQKVWDLCTAGDLKGRHGFRKCLQNTLYRPRDLLALLNDAFYRAGKNAQSRIVGTNIESAAREISRIRLDDLRKEYNKILPGLPAYIGAFHGCNPDLTVDDARGLLESTVRAGSEESEIQQDFYIFDSSHDILKGLYSIGFLGVHDAGAGTFVFCHDGRAPTAEFDEPDRILIHPCYWMALNCTRGDLDLHDAEEIHDEYDIEVSSETPAIRNRKIANLREELLTIPLGEEGANKFEKWCHTAIRICFAKGLRNVELKPNKGAKARRDVVATNLGEGDVWRRIYDDFGSRQVTFEIKNVENLTAEDYHQVRFYLSGQYGRIGFIVARSESTELYKNGELEWVRELYAMHNVLIVKLTGRFLSKQLDKLRNPQKHDAVDNSIHSLLDTYTRLYVVGETKSEGRAGKRRRRNRRAGK